MFAFDSVVPHKTVTATANQKIKTVKLAWFNCLNAFKKSFCALRVTCYPWPLSTFHPCVPPTTCAHENEAHSLGIRRAKGTSARKLLSHEQTLMSTHPPPSRVCGNSAQYTTVNHLASRAIFNWVLKVIQDWIGFALLCCLIGLENSRHPLSQSDVN